MIVLEFESIASETNMRVALEKYIYRESPLGSLIR